MIKFEIPKVAPNDDLIAFCWTPTLGDKKSNDAIIVKTNTTKKAGKSLAIRFV
jgi:hypothetical protein